LAKIANFSYPLSFITLAIGATPFEFVDKFMDHETRVLQRADNENLVIL